MQNTLCLVPFSIFLALASNLPTSGSEVVICPPLDPQQESSSSIEVHSCVEWQSRYASEGRDSLDGDSIWSSCIELGWKQLSTSLWYGNSPDQDYDELQLSLAATQSIGDLEFFAAYTHLKFPFDATHDDEIGAGLTWSNLPYELEFSAEAYYSFDATGTFAEIALARQFQINEQLAVDVSSNFGLNQGYVADGHNGANHVSLQMGFEYAISDALSLTAQSQYSWGISRDLTHSGDELLVEFLNVTVGLHYAF